MVIIGTENFEAKGLQTKGAEDKKLATLKKSICCSAHCFPTKGGETGNVGKRLRQTSSLRSDYSRR